MNRIARRLGFGMLCAAVGGAGLIAQQPSEPSEPQVTFKVEINYVEVDAAVFDRNGNFVGDLGPDDFEVFEDGVKQEVTAFTLVNIPIQRAEPQPLQATFPVEPDVVSNEDPFDGRLYVIVLDDKHVAASRTVLVKRAATDFVERYMADNDLAAVITTSGRTQATQEFTDNKRLLLRAVDAFLGQKLRSETQERLDEYYRQRAIPRGEGDSISRIDDPIDMQRGYDARVTLETLSNLSEWVGGIRGRRKAIVFVSEGIDYDIYNFNRREASTIQEKMQEVIAKATRSNVSIYGVDPRGLTSGAEDLIDVSGTFPTDPLLNLSPQSFQDSLRLAQDSLRSLSEETGGFAAVNTNDYSDAFSRVVRESSNYYVLGYYPTNSRRDGRFRKIDVRVNRPGVEVRSRRGYTAPRGKAPEKPKPEGNEQASPEIREALDSPLPLPALTMRMFAAPFKGADDKSAVAVTVEVEGADFQFATKDGKLVSDLEVSTIAIDATGKIKDGDRSLVNFALRPENVGRFGQTGVRLATRLDVPPGRYQLRVAGRETGGNRVGSVMYDLTVPDFTKDPLMMSGITVASATGQRLSTVKPDEVLQAVMPASPVAERDFPRGDELAVYAEIYDNDVKAPHKVDIVTTVTSEDGRAVFSTSEERDSSELQGRPGGYGTLSRIALKDFAPGPYLLTIEAKSRTSGNAEPVSQSLLFNVR